MKVTLLGTGTSGGVPSLGCNCKVCRSTDPRDRHLRSAALLETSSTRVLIDCGPDIREQLLPFSFGRIDAVLLTHCHYDHVGGNYLFPNAQVNIHELDANALKNEDEDTVSFLFNESNLFNNAGDFDLKTVFVLPCLTN